ncbi:MAG: bifunctional DNA-formamidopyrimidine glycosylase/DNA-(apurinic or apyrimidinic site) lyase [Acidobacteriota bacterium]
MPELPEVEVLRRSLKPRLVQQQVERVEILSPALREPMDRRALRRLGGRMIGGLRRRAKYLLIDFEGGITLVIHLGMSGRFTLVAGREPVAKHEHLAFHLATGERLRLVDPRRFGMAFTVATPRIEQDRHFAHLGVEPLGSGLTPEYLSEMAHNRRGPIKSFLMDARIVVGVGNIYASEALWRARVHPKRSVARISAATWGRLTEAVRAVLAQAIEEGGTTLNDFADGEGNAGYFQVSLAVYGREGEPCSSCDRLLKRFVQTGRSTFYCPGCQH